jgi:energy-coupling factor transport system ATP-binding protein
MKVELSNFSFRYLKAPRRAVSGVNMTVGPGDFLLIAGASGSGKSTLCYALSGLIPWFIDGEYGGSILLDGTSIESYTIAQVSSRLGLVLQNPDEQLVTFEVFDELSFGPENLCLEAREIRARVGTWAERLSITHLLAKNSIHLSGGEKQKTVIGSILTMSPAVLVFDEPFAFLDLETQAAFVDLLQDIRRFDPDRTIVVVEHRLEALMPLATKLVVLDPTGDIAFAGTPAGFRALQEDTALALGLRQPRKGMWSALSSALGNSRWDALLQPGFRLSPPNASVPGTTPLLETRDLSFAYTDVPVLSGVDLRLRASELVALVGPNGVGKSTLLFLLAAVIAPGAGTIWFKGSPLHDIPFTEYAPQIGLIFQNPESQLFCATVAQELTTACQNFGVPPPDLGPNSPLLALINVAQASPEEVLARSPMALSWGQKRRLTVASILAYSPALILLDEPFIGQDQFAVTAILDALREYRSGGGCVLVSTHDPDILAHCDRVLVLEPGAPGIQEYQRKREVGGT